MGLKNPPLKHNPSSTKNKCTQGGISNPMFHEVEKCYLLLLLGPAHPSTSMAWRVPRKERESCIKRGRQEQRALNLTDNKEGSRLMSYVLAPGWLGAWRAVEGSPPTMTKGDRRLTGARRDDGTRGGAAHSCSISIRLLASLSLTRRSAAVLGSLFVSIRRFLVVDENPSK